MMKPAPEYAFINKKLIRFAFANVKLPGGLLRVQFNEYMNFIKMARVRSHMKEIRDFHSSVRGAVKTVWNVQLVFSRIIMRFWNLKRKYLSMEQKAKKEKNLN